ncbi:MAG: glycogen debranching enzyme family protein [Rhizobacter sp.]|nr:glycogen debranching enzyme family protein [Ferruginibacter sp.]
MENLFAELSGKEYLLTNGIGGYCSSTFSGANTRRYHGLLVASFNPPTERKVLVSKIEEKIICDGKEYELSANQYPGAIHPKGFQYIADHGVTHNQAYILFKHENFRLQKLLSVADGENTSMIEYSNFSDKEIELQLNPLLVYKDYHSLFNEAGQFDFYAEQPDKSSLKIFAAYGAMPLFIKITKGDWQLENKWYKNFQHTIEKERGFHYEEDALSIGTATVQLKAGDKISIVFSTEENASINKSDNDKGLFTENRSYPSFIKDLEESSRQFVVQRKSTGGSTIIAGYHWFTDWGRDTMIALRGISIATLRQEEAKSILQTFLQYLDKGMLPNRFPDNKEELEYNTVDATLWLFVTLYEYQLAFNDNNFIKNILPALESIIDEHIKGTRYNIHITDEGLLYAGEDGVQLTWMDAKVNGYVVTPRIGCPVEINLLWYNALKIYQQFYKSITKKVDIEIGSLISKFERSFATYFINQAGYLNDVLVPGISTDTSIRPNQIYAASLPFSPLNKEQKGKLLDVVEKNLLTDFGLRTLNSKDPGFKPLYKGNSWERDTAYHQGTVWPFLWGEWALAYLQHHGTDSLDCLYIWNSSKKLQQHFYSEGCLNAIAEIFDGLKPANGKGCVQQAWSVSMLLRVFLDNRFDYSLIADK